MEKGFLNWATTPQELDVSLPGWIQLSQTGYGSVHLPWMKYRTPKQGTTCCRWGASFCSPQKGCSSPQMGHGSPKWYTTSSKVGYFPSKCGYSITGWVRDPKST